MDNNEVSDEILERYKHMVAATVYSALSRMGYENCIIEGVKPFTPGQKLVSRARTLRYLPIRPDLVAEVRGGQPGMVEPNNPDSPEYVAMGSCGPGYTLVVDAMGKPAANIGDVKSIQLKMVNADGFITDGYIRDLDPILGYGFVIYAGGRTPKAARGVMTEYAANVDIQCGGTLVRPGDLIIGDDDGVVVVPKHMAVPVIEWAEEHEAAEKYVLELVQKEGVPPGTYYPPTDEFKARMRRERSS